MNGSAVPYAIAVLAVVGWWLMDGWLQRRTGQSWWALDQLEWGVISAGLAMLMLYTGHAAPALLAAGAAVWQLATARRNWARRRPSDLLERNRLELERQRTGREAEPPVGRDGLGATAKPEGGHELRITVRGRPARVLGRLLDRATRRHDDPAPPGDTDEWS
jgi:hypothetical protein